MTAPSVFEPGRLLKQVGRYAIFDAIASGGMATVHFARLAGPAGFSRIVAIKRMHPHLAKDPDFTSMFLDEARLVARIRHPNVVPTLDVVFADSEIFVVMEYIQGDSLSSLRRVADKAGQRLPLPIAAAVMVGMLHGLHAAHEAKDERGEALGIVHRDVSPHNVLVGIDGVARVHDFGIAKAVQSLHATRPGTVMGKSDYMAPEQIRGKQVNRLSDIFPAGIVFWELLTGRRMFEGQNDEERIHRVLHSVYQPPSAVVQGIPSVLDAIVMKALQPDPAKRYQTAAEFAEAIEHATPLASQLKLGEYVAAAARDSLSSRAEIIRQIEISKVMPVTPDDVASGAGPRDGGAATVVDRKVPGSRDLDVPTHGTTHGTALVGDPRAAVSRSRLVSYMMVTVLVTVAAIAIAFFQGRASTRTAAREDGNPVSASGSPPSTTVVGEAHVPGPTGVFVDSLPPASTVVSVDSLPPVPVETASSPTLPPPPRSFGRSQHRAPTSAPPPAQHDPPEPPAPHPYRPTEL